MECPAQPCPALAQKAKALPLGSVGLALRRVAQGNALWLHCLLLTQHSRDWEVSVVSRRAHHAHCAAEAPCSQLWSLAHTFCPLAKPQAVLTEKMEFVVYCGSYQITSKTVYSALKIEEKRDLRFELSPASKDLGSLVVALLLCVSNKHPPPGTSDGTMVQLLFLFPDKSL